MFIQSCFIRKNTPELQKKLKELGYKKDYFIKTGNCIATAAISEPCYCIITEEMFDDTNPNTTWSGKHRIDCGTNEELFLAIAALRNDTDENQWFTDGNDWFLNIRNHHKATVEELIEHFKK